jgi:hypothetical protein
MSVDTKNPVPPKPIEKSNEQAIPLGPYYETILNNPQPLPKKKPEEPPSSVTDDGAPSPPTKPSSSRGRKPKDDKPSSSSASPSAPQSQQPTPTPPPSNAAERARVVFGSRLAGPAERAERLAGIRAHSSLVAGVLVPPRPDEPDNCCMSGCVNCVWDTYRDEIEDWASASAEAERRLRAQDAGIAAGMAESSAPTPAPAAAGMQSMDDGGGGSQTTWDGSLGGGEGGNKLAKDFWDEELYRNLPVGIREFMKHEKRLKAKHMKDGTLGG